MHDHLLCFFSPFMHNNNENSGIVYNCHSNIHNNRPLLLDLKDAYYSVKVSSKFQKYLKFFHEGKLYKFTAWPNGLSPCPRKFTKILKQPFANLRLLGHIIADTLITLSSRVRLMTHV